MSLEPFGAAALNQPLIGEPGSRSRLETPAAVLDLDIFERNITKLAETCKRAGIAFRPHAKSHKCAEIARRQMAAGASGICCAKPGELLALFEGGSQRPDAERTDRQPGQGRRAGACGSTRRAHRRRGRPARPGGGLCRGCGTPRHALRCLRRSRHRAEAQRRRQCTRRRSRSHAPSRTSPACAMSACRPIRAVSNISTTSAPRRAANDEANRILATVLAVLKQADLAPGIVSGGGTGSHLLDGQAQVLTEVQPGSYVFMDEAYNDGRHLRGRRAGIRAGAACCGHGGGPQLGRLCNHRRRQQELCARRPAAARVPGQRNDAAGSNGAATSSAASCQSPAMARFRSERWSNAPFRIAIRRSTSMISSMLCLRTG